MDMEKQMAFLAVFRSALQHKIVPEIAQEYWADVLEIADRQHVYALIGEKLSEIPTFSASDTYEQVLRKSVRYTLEQEKREAQFLLLYRAMKEKGLHPLVMKGLACRAAYGTLGRLRPSGDEDLLIAPEEFWNAWQVLEDNGYHPTAKEKPRDVEQVHHVLFRSEQGYIIELHVRPIGLEPPFLQRMDRCFDGAHSRAVTMEWKGEALYTLCPVDHYLLLIFHMAKHFCSLGFGIRPLADMAVHYTQYANAIQLDEVYAALDDCGLMPLYSDLVHIANEHLGFSLPERDKTVAPEKLLEHMLDGGVLGGRNAAGLVSSVVVSGSMSEDHHLGKTLWHMVFPAREKLLQVHPEYAGKPLKWLIHYPRRWFRGMRAMMQGATPIRTLRCSRERLKMLRRYGIG